MQDEKTILLVEDEPFIAINQRTVLQRNGLHVRVVHSGEKAVSYATENTDIDLVLMDIDLGHGIDGITCAQRILAVRDIPIVFLTGHASKEKVQQVRSTTRYGYVLKNAGEFVLIEAVAMAFELFEAHQRTREREKHLESVLQSVPIGIGSIEDRTITTINEKACRIVGYDPEELIGKSIEMLYARSEDVGSIDQQATESPNEATRATWQRKTGEEVEVEISVSRIDVTGPRSQCIFTVLDVSGAADRETPS